MKLYLISLPTQQTTLSFFTQSAKDRDIELEILEPEKVNPLKIKPNKGDGLYRVSDGKHYGCVELEYHLLQHEVATFYKDNSLYLVSQEERDSFIFNENHIPVPKTVNYIPKDRSALREVVEELGGFPIVIKALGGSHGVGVMRLDSYESLFSVSDYILAKGGKFVLKEYINVKSSARLIVLGDKVIDSIEYRANPGDFRSNEGSSPNVFPATFSEEIQKIAVDSVKALELEFGGVDILISDNRAVVSEVNFPAFFARCQKLTGTDITGMMIDYLSEKSKKMLGE